MMKDKLAWGAAAVIAATVAVVLVRNSSGETYWHQGSIRVPCTVVKPYDPWVSPDNGQTYVLRYDYTAVFKDTGTNLPRASGFGGPNHSRQSYLLDGFVHPLEPEPDKDNYYPAPTAEMGCIVDQNGRSWNDYNSSPCPIASLAAYQSQMVHNAVWIGGANYYASKRAAECSSAPPTSTATRSPTAPSSPTPVITFCPQAPTCTPVPACPCRPT